MWTTAAVIGAAVLFFAGIWLSAFFSGAETGFYRVSFLRLSIDAHAGDPAARRIMWFAQKPGYFVATTLIGNNIANYLTTFAIGLVVVIVLPLQAGWLEIVATLMLSPIVFVFGELLPKNLYYRAPLFLLRRAVPRFDLFFRLFLVVSFPLIWISKLFERFGDVEDKQLGLVLGRSRLAQVLSQGHREGLLTDVQSRLMHGLMNTAAERITDSMTPSDRILGVSASASREEFLEYAQKFGISNVTVKSPGREGDWYGYLRVADVKLSPGSLASSVHTMPHIETSASKLEALLTLRSSGKAFGVVHGGDTVLGIVSERGLVQQLFRPPEPIVPRVSSAE